MVLRVDLKEDSYDILIEKGILEKIGPELAKRLPCQKWMIVTDENVDSMYGERVADSIRDAGLTATKLTLPPGEGTKSLKMLEKVYTALCEAGITRSDGLIALGGGVIGDLAGFAASTYLRGIRYVQVPTSLLAQVDSAVGGKVAVDLPQGKNLVGSFYQPKCVLLDPLVLESLPDSRFYDGMGEVIKYGCIRDEALFDLIAAHPGRAAITPYLEEIVARCLTIKADIVSRDERDTGERMLLNFGHTLGHAIETLQGFEGYSHGEAVAAGMHLICRLAEEKGLTPEGTAERLEKCLKVHHLPISVHLDDPGALTFVMGRDKKNLEGSLRLVLLDRMGKARLHKAAPDFFKGVEKWLM